MAKVTLTQQTQTLDGHSGLGDRPNINDGLSATQLKTRYDRDVNRNKDFINDTLIAELQANDGAYAIGFNGTDDNVGDMLATIIAAGSGSIPPDGTVTNAKLAADVKVGSLAALTTTEKGSVVGAINEVNAKVLLEQYEEANAEQTTTSISYVDALTLTVTSAGDYIVNFLADLKTANGATDPSIRVYHNTTTLYEFQLNDFADWSNISGIAKITASATDTIKIQFKHRVNAGLVDATIRNARLHIKEYQGS